MMQACTAQAYNEPIDVRKKFPLSSSNCNFENMLAHGHRCVIKVHPTSTEAIKIPCACPSPPVAARVCTPFSELKLAMVMFSAQEAGMYDLGH